MMDEKERESISNQIINSYFAGREMTDCFAINLEIGAKLINATPLLDNQQLRCAIAIHNHWLEVVEQLSSRHQTGHA